MEELRFKIYQRINEPPLFMGQPMGEIVPAIVLFLVFMFDNPFIGVLFSATWFVGVRAMKQGRGQGWLLSFMYWHLPEKFFELVGNLKATPPSYKRFWLL